MKKPSIKNVAIICAIVVCIIVASFGVYYLYPKDIRVTYFPNLPYECQIVIIVNEKVISDNNHNASIIHEIPYCFGAETTVSGLSFTINITDTISGISGERAFSISNGKYVRIDISENNIEFIQYKNRILWI